MPTEQKYQYREEWLSQLTLIFGATIFPDAGYHVPEELRVTCGFPSRSATGKRRAIGQCFDAVASDDKHFEIFISPTISDPMEVADTLAHEIIHATVGIKAKHGKLFVACMKKIGLEGKPTATVAGDAFKQRVTPLLAQVGKYPHATLNPLMMLKKQSTRLMKVVCRDCGYTARVTRKWLDDVGAPLCPGGCCQKKPMEKEESE